MATQDLNFALNNPSTFFAPNKPPRHSKFRIVTVKCSAPLSSEGAATGNAINPLPCFNKYIFVLCLKNEYKNGPRNEIELEGISFESFVYLGVKISVCAY